MRAEARYPGTERMGAKRALVVDDSRAARAFLSRMLEKYEIEVDGVESAEQAIAYLVHHRPDVIFMDHLMPGMDGFQAVQAIKDDPRTATIPIMMYTSQEGELYVGQARALGAVGVLPKQIRPADVSKVLYQLHLLPERRSDTPGAFRSLTAGSAAPERGAEASPVAAALEDLELREELAELRRSLTACLEEEVNRLSGELRAGLEEMLAGGSSHRAARFGRGARRPGWGWAAAAVAAVAAAASLAFAVQSARDASALTREVAQLQAALALAARPAVSDSAPIAIGRGSLAVPAALRGSDAAGAADTAAGGAGTASMKPLIEEVPYGENPLAGPRFDVLRQLFDRLTTQGYRGIVEIRSFPGRFCLVGNATDGYSLAPDETSFAKCDLVGGGSTDAPAQPQSIPLAFADLAGEVRHASHGTIDVQVLAGDERSTIVPYPPLSDSLTAGEWNRAGAVNNRIEIRLR